MSDQEKDTEKIRALLRQKLSDNSPADNLWNVPSEDVWSGLSDELQTNNGNGKSNGILYLFAALSVALLTVLLLRECTHNRTIDELKTEVRGWESNYTELEKNCIQQSNSETENDILKEKNLLRVPEINNNPSSDFPSNENTIQKERTKDEKENPVSKPLGVNLPSDEFKNILASSFSPLNLGNNLISSVGSLNTIEEKNSFTTVNSLEVLPLLSIFPLNISEKDLRSDFNFPKPDNSAKGLVLVPSVYVAISRTGNRLSGQTPDIISNQKALTAYRTGLGLEAVLSRNWSIQTGLYYSSYRIQTDYGLEVAFTHENEYQHDDGNIDNEYNHSLPSSMGNYPAQFVLTRADDALIHEGELMNLELSIRQRSQFLSLPIHLRYGFGKSRLRAGIKTGVVANRTLEVSSEMPTLVSNHSEIHQRHTSIGDPLSDNLEKSTLDVSFGIDFRYQFAPRMGISLETNYQRGITPIYQDDTVKNYLDAGNVGLGFHFIF